MNSIDSYYELTIQCLESLSLQASNQVKLMKESKDKHHELRHTPVIIDLINKAVNASVLFAKFDTLSYINIEDVNYTGNFEETWVKPVNKPAFKTRDSK